MSEYRDIIVVFMALAIVTLLIFVAATIQAPNAEMITDSPGQTRKVEATRLRFGEPVIKTKTSVMAKSKDTELGEKDGTNQPGRIRRNSQPVSFETYIFPVTTNGMRRAIESITPALIECYDQWSSLDKSVGVGAWQASFHFKQSPRIEATSRVVDIKLAHPSPDAPVMEQCLLEIFEVLRFETGGPRVFKHPLVFQ